jgi:hypothetical protein
MYNFLEVSKNQYPYRTLHLDTCTTANKSYSARSLSADEIGRMELYRVDICKRCMPRQGEGLHPGHLYAHFVQREYEAKAARQRRIYTLARQEVALELALKKVRVTLMDEGIDTLPQYAEAVREYRETMADGTYTPDELTVTVGRTEITKRPSYY